MCGCAAGWTPPPLAFPIIWSTIGLLRAASSVMIWDTTGSGIALPLVAMAFHLSVGDCWNHIKNVERREGELRLSVLLTTLLALNYNAQDCNKQPSIWTHLRLSMN